LFKNTKRLQYINGDLNQNYADTQIDITNIPFPENSFDYIICSHVLGHVPNEAKAIQEIKRVLKPTGNAFILTLIDWKNPDTFEDEKINSPEERLKHYSEPDLLRLHGSDFSKRLENEGFHVDVIDYASKLEKETRTRFSLGNGDRETIFKCTK
jgi:ubiquinone/menaquinone biosynthesis C-methylase UbiE